MAQQDSQRVVWYEGMTLDPHHLQQWDRYQRRRLDARVRLLSQHGQGFATIDIDQERLANGELVVRACSGVMPDGLVFDIPKCEQAPAPRNVSAAFAATEERLPVFLAIPTERPQGANVLRRGTENRRATRFIAESIDVSDENTGAEKRRVEVARANVQLRFGGEPLEAYAVLPLAEIIRDAGGAFVLDDRFIPPCLRISVSETLMAITRRLLERLAAKSAALKERQQNAAAQRELSPADVTALGLLGSISTYVPLLKHHLDGGSSHPEALYTTLLALAGQLSAYLLEAGVEPRRLPAYGHSTLSDCFHALDATLRDLLGGARPASNYVRLNLEQRREDLYAAPADPALLRSGQFFVVARAPGRTEEDLASVLPRKLRVASPDTIDGVIRSYTRALPLQHTHRLPVGLPIDEQASYFQLQQRGPFWEAIAAEGAVALFTPPELSDLRVELVAVKRG